MGGMQVENVRHTYEAVADPAAVAGERHSAGGIDGDLIIVSEPEALLVAIYAKPTALPQLILKKRTESDDYELFARAWQAANDKARELSWIV